MIKMSASIISTALDLPNDESENEASTDASGNDDKLSEDLSSSAKDQQQPAKEQEDKKISESEIPKPKGKLKIDATVADQMIKYPTDLDLLNDSRQESERIIDILCEKLEVEKPRTYRKKARQHYLSIAKKKRKTAKEIRKAIGKQLNYLRRNLKSINALLDQLESIAIPLTRRDRQIFWVIQHIYAQQFQMHKEKTYQCNDRIVNIYQPYVRPMVRGKAKAPVEFGAKLGVSEFNGYARINTLSWDAYHEAGDLKEQVEKYKKLHGYYPAVVIADKIYGTRENRNWLTQLGIRYSGKPLGRPTKKVRRLIREAGQEKKMESVITWRVNSGKPKTDTI